MKMRKGKCMELASGAVGPSVKTPILDRIAPLREQQVAKEQALAERKVELEALLSQLRQDDSTHPDGETPSQGRADLERKTATLIDSIHETEEDLFLLTKAISQLRETATPEIVLRAKALCDADCRWEHNIIRQLAGAWSEVHKLIREFKAHRQSHKDQMKQLEEELCILNLNPSGMLNAEAFGFSQIHIGELSWYLKRCLDVTFSNPLHGNEEAGLFKPEMLLHEELEGHRTNPPKRIRAAWLRR